GDRHAARRPDGIRVLPRARADQPWRGHAAPRPARRGARGSREREGPLSARRLAHGQLSARAARRHRARARRHSEGTRTVRRGNRAGRACRRRPGSRAAARGACPAACGRRPAARARAGTACGGARRRNGTGERAHRRGVGGTRGRGSRRRGRSCGRRGRPRPHAARSSRPRERAPRRGAHGRRPAATGCASRRCAVALARHRRAARRGAGAALTAAAERRLRDAGANGYRPMLASILPSLLADPAKPLTIATLGRFGVLRDGRPIAHEEWQSKKARDLLKILVVRRGRQTPRELLMEALWPGDDPSRLSNRLSVALSTLRSVLDPERRQPADFFVAAYGDAVELRLARVDVDAERFLEAGNEGLRLRRDDAARARLESAEAMYLGEFLDEDLYEDWATPLREELRAMYLAVTTALAELADDPDAAVRYRLRVLERDPYDEGAHLGVTRALIDAGRHGEARRSYRRYVARMTELGIEASPFPSREAAGTGAASPTRDRPSPATSRGPAAGAARRPR